VAEEIIEAPMVGKIIEVMAKVGEKIAEGDVVCTLESMKMENPLVSPIDGTVKEIKVAAGDTVQAGAEIAVIE
jgi:biotin carboxyl carrier protein